MLFFVMLELVYQLIYYEMHMCVGFFLIIEQNGYLF